MKPTALDKYLSYGHHCHCMAFGRKGDPRYKCTCGYDEVMANSKFHMKSDHMVIRTVIEEMCGSGNKYDQINAQMMSIEFNDLLRSLEESCQILDVVRNHYIGLVHSSEDDRSMERMIDHVLEDVQKEGLNAH